MNEIRLVIKARNNRLIRLREDLGLSPGEMAARLGIDYRTLWEFEAFKVSPIDSRRGKIWKENALKIADYHGVPPEYIWPESVQELKARTASIEVSAKTALQWDSWKAPELPNEDRTTIAAAVQELPERQVIVLTKRYGLDGSAPMTLDEIGAELGITRERVRQIEFRAYSNLRSPSAPLRELLPDYDGKPALVSPHYHE